MARVRRVAALPGEGIGPEVVDAALQVLRRAAEICGSRLEIERAPFGKDAYRELGSYFPETTAEVCRRSDGILLGAVERGGLLELRKHFDFFANLRPVRARPCLAAAAGLPAEKVRDLDILFVRELTSGLPFGESGRGEDARGPFGFHTMLYHDHEVRRVVRVALEHASRRRRFLTVAHKQNALPCIPWCELAAEEAAAFPDVRVEPMLVDTLAMTLVEDPLRFDVIVSENLTGDWLSSLGAGLIGTIGVLPSASLNAEGFGLYEPIHGTAPEIAGRGIANPIGAIGSVVLMLRQWGEEGMAALVANAVERILEAGWRTPDIAVGASVRRVSTRGMTERIVAALDDGAAGARANP
ncbi:MAG TPA: isocitrate/isopropylmalate family dehydrogenase [Candidatus Binatia bacterium]|nr:isocitrate/isopropylmalate family dehydrogenase [Candidatus Binatia bacterium]